jgi:serine protease Do
LTWDDVEAEGLPSADGAMVNSVIAGTPAEKAGLRPGDVIVGFDGQSVRDAQHFMRLIWMAKADTEVLLSLLRQGKPEEIAVRLGDRETVLATADETPAPTAEPAERWLGLSVETSTPRIAERLNTTYRPGVLVVDIDPEGPAYDKGIRAGMVIGEIDHQQIENLEDYHRVVGALADRKKAVSLLVYDRRGNTGYIAVRPEYYP